MTRLSPSQRRVQLLDAGRRLWAARSFDAVTTTEISEATGTSIGLVYHHFGSKRGYYVATVREVASDLIQATEPLEGDESPEALAGVLRRFVDFVERNASVYRAVLRGGLGADAEVAEIAEEVRLVNVERVFDLLGLPPDPRTRAVVYGWVGFCEAVALDHLDRPQLPSEAVVALLLDSLQRLLS